MREVVKNALRDHPRIFRAVKSARDWVSSSPRRFVNARKRAVSGASTGWTVLTHPWFIRDLLRYRSMGGHVPVGDLFPQVHDKTSTTPFDPHYFHQVIWAARRIRDSGAPVHFDVGSANDYVGMLAAFTRVTFIDIRPLTVEVADLTCIAGTVLDLPYLDKTLPSLSCMHVAEHIGLGRYGDPLDPDGTVKAIKELQRVLAPGGNLYFSLPVGATRTEFNAHRVSDPRTIVALFDELELSGFSITDDMAVFHEDVPVDGWETQRYACGMFHLTRAL